MIGHVSEGLVDSTIATAGGLAQHYPPLGAFDLPVAYRDMREQGACFASPPAWGATSPCGSRFRRT